jgi:hypothetical protein
MPTRLTSRPPSGNTEIDPSMTPAQFAMQIVVILGIAMVLAFFSVRMHADVVMIHGDLTALQADVRGLHRDFFASGAGHEG